MKSDMPIIKKIYNLLSSNEKKKAIGLLFMISIMAVLDVIGVASIMPFMGVVANPETIESNSYLNFAYNYFNFKNYDDFLYFLGLCVFLLLVLSLSFKSITLYFQYQFAYFREYTIGKRLLELYLKQPYAWFLSKNSSDLGKTVLSEVHQIIYQGLTPLLMTIAQTVVAIAILLLLLLIDWKLALMVFGVLGTSYMSVFMFFRKFITKIGNERFNANEKRFSSINEAFGAIKTLKIDNLEDFHINKFSLPAKIYAKRHAAGQVVAQLPKFLLEGIAFGGLLITILYLLSAKGSISEALPILSLYAFAGYRLMPALQQIYTGVSNLKFSEVSLDAIHQDLELLSLSNKENVKDFQNINPINFNNRIQLIDISFRYSNTTKRIINQLNLNINKGSQVAFVGETGSGKTTTIDILMGLLTQDAGDIYIDDKKLNAKDLKLWYKSIGYVPQSIYLSDDSVISNIAFGIDYDDINVSRVKKVAKIAQLHDFITKELTDGYETIVGERGSRLSGGQIQRIGIARALYKNPEILVLDEATSSLDADTEYKVMESIKDMDKKITVIMVAHRLNTIKHCEKIFVLKDGCIEKEGKYDDLLISSQTFRKLSQINIQ